MDCINSKILIFIILVLQPDISMENMILNMNIIVKKEKKGETPFI